MPQCNVMEVEGLNRMEDAAQPLVEIDGSARPVKGMRTDASTEDPGRTEDVPQTCLEEMVVAPPVRPEEEIGSGHAEGAAQAHTDEGVPPPSMVVINVPIPGAIEGGDAGSVPLTVVPLALPLYMVETRASVREDYECGRPQRTWRLRG